MKKLLSVFLTICLFFSTTPYSAINVFADTSEDYTYVVLNGEVTITGVNTSISGDITIPSTLGGYPVTSIGDYAFFRCFELTSVTIPYSVTRIGYYAFNYCYALESVTMGNNVTIIGDGAFAYCAELNSITIPDSVESIGNGAFYWCDSLTGINIPDNVESIGNEVFYCCDNLTDISVNSSNKFFCDIDGVLFNKSKTEIICYPEGKSATSYDIPESVTNIARGAFYWCDSLEDVTIPDSVESIGEEAFYCCCFLLSITVPDSVTSIGESAFYECSDIKNVYYRGSSENRNHITVGNFNNEFVDATWYYNSCIGSDTHTYLSNVDKNCKKCGYIREFFAVGDINNDKAVDTVDLAMLKLFLAGVGLLDEASFLAVDINGDKIVDTIDLAVLKLYLAGAATLQ